MPVLINIQKTEAVGSKIYKVSLGNRVLLHLKTKDIKNMWHKITFIIMLNI